MKCSIEALEMELTVARSEDEFERLTPQEIEEC